MCVCICVLFCAFRYTNWAFVFLRKVKVKSPSRVLLFATPWTVAHQAPPSMGFSRQEYWSGLPFPSFPKCIHHQHLLIKSHMKEGGLHLYQNIRDHWSVRDLGNRGHSAHLPTLSESFQWCPWLRAMIWQWSLIKTPREFLSCWSLGHLRMWDWRTDMGLQKGRAAK